ncbi:MAG: beta-galactosidase [Lachnospiraceae bacterium]|nr:beta-galactosidase [Lachnospiraceae bacterium]
MKERLTEGHLLYGGDYNPEQWLDRPNILQKDIDYMKEAHINVVSLGIFAWSVLEPAEGDYQLEWLAEIIEELYKNGIYTILATPSGARPKWLADRYPEVLRVDETGHRNFFGFRHNHCYTSPIYRKKVAQINRQLSNRLGEHPGVIMWHISNEYGGECYCPLCQHEFRKWLEKKYKNIEVLNDKWCTTFWSHRYQSFAQIEAPSRRGEPLLHALNLDWRRFVTDRTIDFAKMEIQAVHKNGNDKPVTTNFMYDFKGMNYAKWKDVLDVISWDNYPTWHKGSERETALDCALEYDRMRSIKGESFLLMESCPSATSWQSVSKLKRPGMLHAASMQAIAHGSDSIQYFQIRQSRGAVEKFHGAVIDHYGGNDTRVFREVTALGIDLDALREIQGSRIHAEAAVIYDMENRWAMEDSDGPRNENMYYRETVRKVYEGLRAMGINVDVVDMEADLASYRIVAAPMNYMYRDGYEKKVREFVASGGTYLTTYWSGVVDECDRCFIDGTPYHLMDVLGIRSKEIDGLYEGEVNGICPVPENSAGLQKTYQVSHLCERIDVTTASTLMTYQHDFYGEEPAVTCNAYKKGKAYYVGADAEGSFYRDLLQHIVCEGGICNAAKESLPEGIEMTLRETEDNRYLFIQNFNRTKTKVDLSHYPGELLMGQREDTIPALGTIIIKTTV